MNMLLDIAPKCAFSNKDEVVKFLFMIHNANTSVKDKLIKSMKPESTLRDILAIAKSVQSTFITEKLPKGDGKPQVQVESVNKWGCSASKGSGWYKPHSNSKGGSQKSGKPCNKCGEIHPPKQCAAFGKACYKCKKKGHFSKLCHSCQSSRPPSNNKRQSHKDFHEFTQSDGTVGDLFMYNTDVVYFNFIPENNDCKEVPFDEINGQPSRLICQLNVSKSNVCADINFKPGYVCIWSSTVIQIF